MINLYIIDYHELIPYKNEALMLLSSERKEKALRYVKEEDMLRSILGSLLIRKYTNGLDDLKYNSYGKPYKDNIYFSLSHSNDYVVLAISNNQIGIDIELIKDVKENLKDYTLSVDEKSTIKNNVDFYKLWTSKESLIKYLGIGIDKDLKKIPALPLEGYKEYQNNKLYSLSFVFKENYALSITTKEKDDYKIIIENINNLLK